MLKFLLLFVVFTYFGVKESDAYWRHYLEWTEGSAINITAGPEDAIYCRLRNSKLRRVFDGFGPCRITVDSVTSDHMGYWRMWYGAPGMVAAQSGYVHVDVIAAETKQVNVTSTAQRNESSVVITSSVPEDEEILACTFRDPSGNLYIASRDEQKENKYWSVAEYKKCTLQLLEPSLERGGIWRSAVQTTRGVSYSFFRVAYSMLNPEDNDHYYIEPELKAAETNVEGPVGGSTTMFCSIDAAIRYCYYRSANGTVINLSPSTSTEDYEYIGNGFEAGECGIIIKNLQSSDRGWWSCNVADVHRFKEHSEEINVYVSERTSMEHRWVDSQVVVSMRLSNLPELEYCRFVRSDGLGFVSENVPPEYILSDSQSKLYGICMITIPRPQAVDLRPWTVIAKVIGEDTERSVTTTFDSRSTPRGTTSVIAIILWCSFGSIFVFLIAVSCLPKKNREWTARRAAIIRTRFRRQPHPQHAAANLPSQHIPQAPVPHPVHANILTDLPPKV